MEWSISSCFLNPGEHLDPETVGHLGELGWRCLDLCAYPEAVLNAPEEYSEVNERYETLKGQIEELTLSRDKILAAINK